MRRLLALTLALVACPALAHDHWIARGHYLSPSGVHCCNDEDCQVVPVADVEVTPAGYYYRPTKEVIPFDEAQKSEDEDYHRCKTIYMTTRCFFAPPPGY